MSCKWFIYTEWRQVVIVRRRCTFPFPSHVVGLAQGPCGLPFHDVQTVCNVEVTLSLAVTSSVHSDFTLFV